MSPKYDEEKAEELYNDISAGELGLDNILEAFANKIQDGTKCHEELSSRFMKDTIISHRENMYEDDIVNLRNKYTDSVKKGTTTAFHREQKNKEIEKRAGEINADLGDLNQVERNLNNIEKEYDLGNQGDDLDNILNENADALKFVYELEQGEKAENLAENNELDDIDEINDLFPMNDLARDEERRKEEERKEREGEKEIYDKVLKAAQNPNEVDLEDEIEDVEKDYMDAVKQMPKNEAEAKQQIKKMEAAKNVEKMFEEFEENLTVKDIMDELNDRELEDLENLDVYDKEFDDRMKKEAEDAKEFLNEINEQEKNIEAKIAPRMKEKNDAYREVDRIERIFKDQDRFSQLSKGEKKRLIKDYLLNNAITLDGYNAADKERLELDIDDYKVTDAINIMVDNLHSGENILNELNTNGYIIANAYGNTQPNFKEQGFDKTKDTFRDHINYVKSSEDASFKAYGTYNGKPKAEVVNEDRDLEELFPENEVQEEKIEERIQRKKDARKELKKKAEINKDRIKKLNDENKDVFKKKGLDAIADVYGGNKGDERERYINITAQEAEVEYKRLKEKI